MDQEIERTGSPFWSGSGSGSGYYQSQASQTVLGRTSSSESTASSTAGGTNRGVKKTWTVVLFLVFSILLLLFLSSFRSVAFRPTVVKSGWESLNIAFLLFAVICGFLGRNKVEDAGVGSGKVVHSPPYTPRLKRSSSSYPDLKEPQQWSFADDLGLYGRERKWDTAGVDRTEEDDDEGEIKSMVVRRNLRDSDFKNVRVDVEKPKLPAVKKSNVQSPPPEEKKIRSPSPPPPPPLPRSTPSRRRTDEGSEVEISPEMKVKKNVDGPPPPPPLPPPSPPPATSRKDKRSQRKRSGGTKDIATAIAAYYQKKRKRNGNGSSKGKRSYDDFLLTSVSSQPPPPPPLPQKSALYHFFRNKKEMINAKSKQIYSSTQPLPATHLPPPATSQIVTVHRPPLPPPLPQRNVPPPEIAAVPQSPEPAPFCPSPDVNNKADLFIARLHAGWRLEKLKSIKDKENQQQ